MYQSSVLWRGSSTPPNTMYLVLMSHGKGNKYRQEGQSQPHPLQGITELTSLSSRLSIAEGCLKLNFQNIVYSYSQCSLSVPLGFCGRTNAGPLSSQRSLSVPLGFCGRTNTGPLTLPAQTQFKSIKLQQSITPGGGREGGKIFSFTIYTYMQCAATPVSLPRDTEALTLIKAHQSTFQLVIKCMYVCFMFHGYQNFCAM